MDPHSGELHSSITLDTEKDISAIDSIVSIGPQTASNLLVWTDKSFKLLKFNVLGSKQIATIRIARENNEEIQKVQIVSSLAKCSNFDILVHYQSVSSHWAEVFKFDTETNSLQKAYLLPRLNVPGVFSRSTQDGDTYFTRITPFETSLFSATSAQSLGRWKIGQKGHDQKNNFHNISYAVSEVVSRGALNFAVRSTLFLASGDLRLIRNGEEAWTRPESLAGVVTAAWADIGWHDSLIEELRAEGYSNFLAAYVHRFQRHLKSLKHFPEWVRGLSGRLQTSLSGDRHHLKQKTTQQDGFGFRKILIAATATGRIFALDTGSYGRILWNIQALEVPIGHQWDVKSIKIEGNSAFIQASDGDFLQVDIVHGEVVDQQPERAGQDAKSSLSIAGRSMSPSFMDEEGSIDDLRRGSFLIGVTTSNRNNHKIVRGWVLSNDTMTSLCWEFIPRPDEEIVSLSRRPAHDPVASIGKALGDRNVLYKYLTPNILVVGTASLASSSVTFYVLDSISGRVLHTLKHAGVDITQPIISTISENWIAYSVFSNSTHDAEGIGSATPMAAKGHQLVVSELYESHTPNDRGALGSAHTTSSLYPATFRSGQLSIAPFVISQIYLLPTAVSFLSTTSTLQGITPRSILCVLPFSNGLLAIPRAVVDPRRPVSRDPTPSEMEEGLFRHSAILDFDPKWTLTHQREVLGISDVITSPSLLESTSLIFAFGRLDLFGTRVTPIGGFDMLGKGFSKMQLLGTVAALAVGTGFLAPMVCPKNISDNPNLNEYIRYADRKP